MSMAGQGNTPSHCLPSLSALFITSFWESLGEPVSILMILLCPPPNLWGFRHMLLHLVITWLLGLKLKSSAWWQVLHPPSHLLASTSSFKWHFVNTPPIKVLASMLQAWGCKMWPHSLQVSYRVIKYRDQFPSIALLYSSKWKRSHLPILHEFTVWERRLCYLVHLILRGSQDCLGSEILHTVKHLSNQTTAGKLSTGIYCESLCQL